MGRARVAHRGGAVVDDVLTGHAETPAECVRGTTVQPGDDQLVDLLGAQLRLLQRGLKGALAERQVAGLTEPLFPELRAFTAGRAPAVDELLALRRGAETLGDHPVAFTDEQ